MAGFGRFARKKQLSQQENAPAANAAVSGAEGVGGQPPNNNNAATSVVAATTDAGKEPTTANVSDTNTHAMEGERPATAFNSFDSDRPATSGSHGFSAVGNMFGGDTMDGGDNAAGEGMFFSATPTDGMYDDDGVCMMEAGQFGFGGDVGGFQGIGGFEGEQQPAEENNDGNEVSGAGGKPPAVTAPTNSTNGAGGGIGFFAKKRAAAAAAPPAAAANAATAIAVAAPNNSPPEHQPANNVDSGPHKNNNDGLMSMVSSVANLSRFDTDLMSKNTEVAVDNVGVGGAVSLPLEAEQGEVPKTIPTSGDDVEDDLTEATAATFSVAMDVDGGVDAPRERSTNHSNDEQQPSAFSKASPYFANPSNGSQVAAAQQGVNKMPASVSSPPTAAALNVCNQSPPQEKLVTTATAVTQQPSPKLGGNLEDTAVAGTGPGSQEIANTVEPMDVSKPVSKSTNGDGVVLSPRQGSTQRVSLSPQPGVNKNQTFSFSPKGNTNASRPGLNHQAAPSLSPKGHATNSIMPTSAVANTNAKAAQSTVIAQLAAGGTRSNASTLLAKSNTTKTGNSLGRNQAGGVGGRTVFPPHQHPAQRVSLSPRPGHNNVGNNQTTASSSPESGRAESNVDQNSIVIPGVTTVMPNATLAAALPTKDITAMGSNLSDNPAGNANGSTLATNGHSLDSFGANQFVQPGQTNDNSRVLPIPTNNSGLRAKVHDAKRQKPSSFMLKRNTTMGMRAQVPVAGNKSNVQNARPNTTYNSRGIGKFNNTNTNTEKVKFAVPETHPKTKSGTSNTDPMGSNGSEKSNGQFGASMANSTNLLNGTTAPSSTAITPDHRRSDGTTAQPKAAVTPFAHGTNQNATISPTPHKSPAPAPTAAPMQYDSNAYDRVVPGMPTANAGPKTIEVEPQAEAPMEAPPQRRPRSQTIYSPPPSTSPESSATPKVSNVNNGMATANANNATAASHNAPNTSNANNGMAMSNANNATAASYNAPKASNANNGMAMANANNATAASYNTNSVFRTDESFDQLLEQFVQDIQAGADIYAAGETDLLELEVDLAHAMNGCLHYTEQYTNLLDEIEGVQAIALEIMSDVAE